MLVSELVSFLYDYAPAAYQETYDNTGLLIGNPDEQVNSVLLAVDVTEALMDEAIAGKHNVVIAHHPLIFSALKTITPKTALGRCVEKAIRHNIAVIAMHTNLDNVAGGVSFMMAKKLGVNGVQVLQAMRDTLLKLVVFCPLKEAEAVRQAIFSAGAGHIGDYDACSFNLVGKGTFRAGESSNPYVGEIGRIHEEEEVRIEVILPTHARSAVVRAMIAAHPYEEVAYDLFRLENENVQAGSGAVGILENPMPFSQWLAQVKKTFGVTMMKHSRVEPDQQVQRIALCGGSGSHLLPDAIKQKADVFISAEFKYHQYFDAAGALILVDMGHFESEQCTKELFYEILSEKKCNFAVHLANTNTNPIEIS